MLDLKERRGTEETVLFIYGQLTCLSPEINHPRTLLASSSYRFFSQESHRRRVPSETHYLAPLANRVSEMIISYLERYEQFRDCLLHLKPSNVLPETHSLPCAKP
jgi:hypothetical protein